MRKLARVLPFLAFALALAGLFLPAAAVEVRGASERLGPWAYVSDGDNLVLYFGGDAYETTGPLPAAGAGGDRFDYTQTLLAQDGSDTFLFWDINLTNANHTGSSNVVRVLDIGNITGDGQSTESALYIGSGWDVDVNGVGSLAVGADDVVVGTYNNPPAADGNTTTNGLNIDYAMPVDTAQTNTHNALNIAAVSANSTGGTNALNGIDIDTITADAQVTEYAINVASGWDRGLNIAGGGAVIVGTFTVDASEIGAAEIANPTRNITIPLLGFLECSTDAGTVIGLDTTADALPDYVNSATDGLGFLLRFDAVSGSPDTSVICSQFQVPQDYASGGTFRISLLRGGDTGATEILNVNAGINQGALATADADTIAGTAEQEINSAPTAITYAAGDSVNVKIWITSGTTADEAVDIYSVSFEYVATQ